MRSRTVTALAGLLVSFAVSLIAWWSFDTLLVFLFVPFVPFLLRREDDLAVRTCPQCGFTTTDGSFEFCPRDGERLDDDQHE